MIQLTRELQTQFRRDLATAEWLEPCAKFIERRIREVPGLQTGEGVGVVRRIRIDVNEVRALREFAGLRMTLTSR
jgi:hypothetical protein